MLDFLGSLHPLVVHLPIGIVLLTLALEVFMKNKNNSIHRAITLGWFLSSISGIVSALFGWLLGDNGYYFESQISIHRWSAILFVLLCFLIWILRYMNFKFSRPVNRLFNLCVVLLLTITGHFGGEMTHGQNYLLDKLPFVEKEITPVPISTLVASEPDSLFVFEDLVYPVLEEKCIACHNAKSRYGGLDMSTLEGMTHGGNSGAGIKKGKPYESLIFKRVSFAHDHPKFMPPAGVPLTYDQIATLEWWIDQGAEKKISLSQTRQDPKIQRMIERRYGLDLREKSFLETLKLSPPAPSLLKTLDTEKYIWRFINAEQSFLDIKFSGKYIELADLKRLEPLKDNIVWLYLSNCKLTDVQLGYLATFPNLTRLRIQNNPSITDQGVQALKGLEHLSELNLYGTRTSDAAFAPLGKMNGLKKLFLWNTRVTPHGIENFRIQHPQVTVVTGL
jgi:uncharacterized membrane protein